MGTPETEAKTEQEEDGLRMLTLVVAAALSACGAAQPTPRPQVPRRQG
jgi:hypothetical protein